MKCVIAFAYNSTSMLKNSDDEDEKPLLVLESGDDLLAAARKVAKNLPHVFVLADCSIRILSNGEPAPSLVNKAKEMIKTLLLLKK
jgi:hypothetical protein